MIDGIAYPALGYGLDIAPSTISLGDGWSGLEIDRCGPFRRIAGDAQALLASAGSVYEITIDIAPAPGAPPSLTCDAHVDGIVYFSDRIGGRTRIRFVIPPGEAAMRRISVKAAGGSARVYRFAALPFAPDVVPHWQGFRIGRGGWYLMEEFENTVFRYVNREAEIVIGRPAKSLELDVEPGPGVAYGPFELDISTGDGKLLRRLRVERRMRTIVELPDVRSNSNRLVLSCKGGGRPSPPDARVMDFRLFAVPVPWERKELLRRLAALGVPPDALQPAANEAVMDAVRDEMAMADHAALPEAFAR